MSSTPRSKGGTAFGRARHPGFTDIVQALAAWKFPEGVDGVVAIAHDGIVPGVLVAQRLGVGLKTITIAYRNEVNEPQFAQPKLVSSVPGLAGWRRVLLVDDVHLTGRSWEAARACLPQSVEVLPFVLAGDVDFALFRRAGAAIHWPWHAD
jgi:adenine/guanine phosphoribosyltransferase-like PRPP-binding protein